MPGRRAPRIGRRRFWRHAAMLVAVLLLTGLLFQPLLLAAVPIGGGMLIVAARRRLRDAGRRGEWLLLPVPPMLLLAACWAVGGVPLPAADGRVLLLVAALSAAALAMALAVLGWLLTREGVALPPEPDGPPARFRFRPRWKEELLVESIEGTAVLVHPMGRPAVWLPDADAWRAAAPAWAADWWGDLHPALAAWCAAHQIALIVSAEAGVIAWQPAAPNVGADG